MQNTTLFTYLLVYILILIGTAWFVSRKQTKEDYLISGRDRKGWQILISKFVAAISASYFITYTGFAYEYGSGVFAILIGIVIGYFFFGYWAMPKIYDEARKFKFYTLGDLVFHRTKSVLAKNTANVLGIIAIYGWLLTAIIGGGKIIADFGLLSYTTATIITGGVVLIYLLIAGFKGVILTDIIQGITVFILIIIVTFSITGSQTKQIIVTAMQGNIDVGNAIGFLIFGITSVYSAINFYQLGYAAKTKKGLKHGMSLAVIPILILASFLLLIGVFMAQHVPGLDPALAFSEALKTFLPINLLPISIVLFFAGITSSIDTNTFAIASHLPLSSKNSKIKQIQIATIILIVLSVILALIFPDVVGVTILAGGLSILLSRAMIYLFAGGKSPKKFIASVSGGSTGFVAGLIIFGIQPVIAITVLLGSGLGLLWKK